MKTAMVPATRWKNPLQSPSKLVIQFIGYKIHQIHRFSEIDSWPNAPNAVGIARFRQGNR